MRRCLWSLIFVLLACAAARAQEGVLLYVPNQATDSVSVLRTNADGTLTAVTTITVGVSPSFVGVRGDQAFAYVSNENANTISVIDTKTQTVVQTVNGPPGGGLLGVTVSPDGSKVYVASRAAADTVQVYASDPLTGLLTSSAAITAGSDPRNMVVSTDGSRLYVANQASNSLSVVDTSTNTVIATVNNTNLCGGCGAFNQVSNVAVSPDGTRVYVTSFGGNRVSVIDTATNTVIATPATGSGPLSVAVAPDGSTYYVVDQAGTISAFRTSDNGLIANSGEIGVLPSHGARGLTIHPGGGFVYATEFSSGANPDNIRMLTVGSGGPLTIGSLSAVGDEPQYPAMCEATHSSGMLRTGSTFFANTNGAFGCFGTSGTFTGGTLRMGDAGLSTALNFTLGTGGGTITTNGNDATIAGIISGGTQLTKTGAGVLTLSGANTYTGTLAVQQDTVQAGASNVLSVNGAVEVGLGATLNLAGFNQTVRALSGSGTVALGTGSLSILGTSSGSVTFAGNITGTGGLTFTAGSPAFLLTLSGTNTYTGPTIVTNATLPLTGSLTSPITLNSSGVLAGAGTTTGTVTVNGGTLSPGAPVTGRINVGGLSFGSGALAIHLNGPLAGTDYDQVNVAGAVTLGSPILGVAVGFTPSAGQVFTIINNDGTDAVAGTFSGLGEGASVTLTGRRFRISYAGGTGNDVVLTAVATPVLTTTASPGVALGGSVVDVASLTGGASPTGTVTFRLFGPNNTSCTGSPIFTDTKVVAGAGLYTSAAFTPSAAGVYRWIASYSGDLANEAVSGACNDPNETVTVVAGCSVSPAQLPVAIGGLPYAQTLTLTNATTTVNWTIDGSLPPGLTFTNGVFAGTPTARGAVTVTVTGTESSTCQASATYTLGVSAERRLLVGADAGGIAAVRAFNIASGVPAADFNALPAFTGGVSVAQGDVDGDGVAEIITGAGPGGGPDVRVFGSGGTLRLALTAFGPGFRSGVEVATGDINGDGVAEILAVGRCTNDPEVRAFDGRTGARVRTYALAPPTWSCGLHIAAGDVNGDGAADLLVGAGNLGSPFVQIVDGSTGTVLRELVAFDPAFTGGVYVAAGDVTGDGYPDIVAGSGIGGAPRVRVFDGVTGAPITGTLADFNAYPATFPGGVRVAAGDLNGDGRAEVITGAGPGGGPHVRVFDGATATEIYGLYALDPSFSAGVFVAAPPAIGRMAIDVAARTTANEVRIAGWALKETATNTTGTDAIHAWAYPVDGSAPIFVGAAPARTPRSDVAAAFGGEFLLSGFDFTGTLAAGTYDLVVFVRNVRTQRFDQVRVVRVTVL